MIKIGDNVRYLNAVGGGVVTKLKGKDIALVLEADGFETPVLIRELVVVEPVNQYNFPTKSKDVNDAKSVEVVPQSEPKPEVPDYIPPTQETAAGEKLNIFLAFVPHDVKQLQTTAMDCYIVNKSNYFLRFSLVTGQDVLTELEGGVLEPHTKLFVDEFAKDQANDLEFLRFQAVAFKPQKAYKAKSAIDVTFRINPTKFYKLHSYADMKMFNAPAMLLTVMQNDQYEHQIVVDTKQMKEAMAVKESSDSKPISKSSKPTNEIIEVDLHITALIDNLNGLTNKDMLDHQMEKFREIMQNNLRNKGQRIVFIHGKGEGVLRKEIEKALKLHYKQCEFQDASFREYGFGATMVTIR